MSLKEPVSDFAIELHEELNNKEFIPSRYEFLKAHKGVRPNTLHGLISNTGAGKTTLTKCIIAETAAVVKCLVWISEETVTEYQALISKIDKSILKNLLFVEERSVPEKYKSSPSLFFEYFEKMYEESGAGMIFIDNVTTSLFYNSRFGYPGQCKAAEYLLNFTKEKCSIFWIGHTKEEVTDNYKKIINPQDIKGPKDLPMLTEYFYTLQKFTSGDKIFNVLRNAKHRHHREAGGFFSLVYEKGYYVGDGKIPFNAVNFLFKGRDYLGQKIPKKAPEIPKSKLDEKEKGPIQKDLL